MQSEAYKITGFSAVMGALGFMVRWIQTMNIYEEETGLPNRFAPVNLWLIGLIVLTLVVLTVWVVGFRKYEAVRDYSALVGPGVAWPIFGIIGGAVLAVSGLFLLVTAGHYAAPVLRRILAVLEALAGVAAALMALHGGKPQQAKTRQIASVLLVLFGCMYMVVVYKENAANPVVWNFAPEILALCAATLALYFLAGYQYGEIKPYTSMFFCYAGVFFCLMCVVDQGVSADALSYIALALLLGLWGYAQTANIKRPSVTGVKQ